MSHELKGLYKLGGAAFVASGLLFLLRAILDYLAGPPPSGGLEILGWIASNRLILSLGNEVLFFATVCLVPAVIALYHSLADVSRAKVVTGCGIMAAAIPVLVVLLIVEGRLVYPAYGIHPDTPDLTPLIVALFYGGMHAIYLLLALATVLLSLAMLGGVYGKAIAYLGFVTAAADIIGAYPYEIGPVPTLVAQVFFAAWFVAVGARLRAAP